MGVMDRFLNYMKVNPDDEDYYDDDYYDDEYPIPKKSSVPKEELVTPEESIKKATSKITPMTRQPRRATNTGMEVCVIKPTSMEDSREITETLLANRTVVLNLEGLDMDVAQRVIDFSYGSCFALNGKMQRISHSIFIFTPPSVDISGDYQELLTTDTLDAPNK
ncbi:MAG: cell division protein SepF [Lachnospiraceae bacterium]|nr:cell division protein SepF [Lachnospiraceae bacterium]